MYAWVARARGNPSGDTRCESSEAASAFDVCPSTGFCLWCSPDCAPSSVLSFVAFCGRARRPEALRLLPMYPMYRGWKTRCKTEGNKVGNKGHNRREQPRGARISRGHFRHNCLSPVASRRWQRGAGRRFGSHTAISMAVLTHLSP